MQVELSPSEFVDINDPVQFFPSSPEPYSYLQYDVHNYISKVSRGVMHSVDISLSDKFWNIERQRYSMMNVLGDFGGFNDGLVIFPSALMGIYSSYFFTRMVAKEVPVKTRRNKKKQIAL